MISKSTSEELSLKEQVSNPEIIQAIHVVVSTMSFKSSLNDLHRFKNSFPDAEIAKQYQQSLFPYVKENIMKYTKGVTFMYQFDETITS